MSLVRVYGVSRSHGSFARVSAGLCEGLAELGLLAGFFPIDAIDETEEIPGATAPIGIYAGYPDRVVVVASHGVHERRFAILAPNSTWLPSKHLKDMQEHVELVAPSEWGATILERYTGKWLPALRHGVSAGFRPAAGVSTEAFNVLHLSSTQRQRKGTAELVEAWKRCSGKLGDNPSLSIVQPGQGDSPADADGIRRYGEWNRSVSLMAQTYAEYSLVCQPSRGEGFGMVGLEALACGTPIAATACTGHSEWFRYGQPGAVRIGYGCPADIDDGPPGSGSQAPTVDPLSIVLALHEAYKRRSELRAAAAANADTIRREWSWATVTMDWLKKIGAV